MALADPTFTAKVADALRILDDTERGVPGGRSQGQISYPSDLFVGGVAMPIMFAVKDGEVAAIAMIITRTITGGPSDVDFRINGTPFATLSTGAGTVGLTVSQILDPPEPIPDDALVDAISDGAATGNSSVALYAFLQTTGTD